MEKELSNKQKFIPNLEQILEAIESLPDPNDYDNPHFSCTISTENKKEKINFIKKKISKGENIVPRWIYEGKFLVREKDKEKLLS